MLSPEDTKNGFFGFVVGCDWILRYGVVLLLYGSVVEYWEVNHSYTCSWIRGLMGDYQFWRKFFITIIYHHRSQLILNRCTFSGGWFFLKELAVASRTNDLLYGCGFVGFSNWRSWDFQMVFHSTWCSWASINLEIVFWSAAIFVDTWRLLVGIGYWPETPGLWGIRYWFGFGGGTELTHPS